MRFIDSQCVALIPVKTASGASNLKPTRNLDGYVKLNVYPSLK